MKMKKILCLAVFSIIFAGAALAEPVDKNRSSFILTPQMGFGQAIAVGDSTPGLAWFLSAEPGYGFAMSTWNRLETGLELGTGALSFKRKSTSTKVDIPISMFALAKIGYGYWIGENTYAVLRLGAGPAMGRYDGELEEDVNAFMGRFAWDILIPASDSLRLLGGVHLSYLNVSGDKIDTFQINVPGIHLGAQLAF